MSDKINQCNTCKHFDVFFIKETTMFAKSNFGKCYVKGDIVKVCDGCPNYKHRANKKSDLEQTVKLRLNDIFSELATLRKYLEMENDG